MILDWTVETVAKKLTTLLSKKVVGEVRDQWIIFHVMLTAGIVSFPIARDRDYTSDAVVVLVGYVLSSYDALREELYNE